VYDFPLTCQANPLTQTGGNSVFPIHTGAHGVYLCVWDVCWHNLCFFIGRLF